MIHNRIHRGENLLPDILPNVLPDILQKLRFFTPEVDFLILPDILPRRVRGKIEAGLIFENPLYNGKNAFLHAAAYIYIIY